MPRVEDDVLEDWISGFEALPADRQENLRRWFGTQKVIIESSGLSPEEWFAHVEWALDHPFDYRFIQEFPESAGAVDGSERSDATRRSRALVGGDTRVALPEPPGPRGQPAEGQGLERELFAQFLRNRLGRR